MPEISEMSLAELDAMLNEANARLLAEDVSEEERAEIEKKVTLIQDQLDILMQRVYQAARKAAKLDPDQPAQPVY